MATHYVKQNDTAPSAQTVIEVSGAAQDLQGATIAFHMVNAAGDLVINAAANNDQNGDGSDGTKGNVTYDWDGDAGDTAKAGNFKAEWEVTFSSGKIRTFPTSGYDLVKIFGELA